MERRPHDRSAVSGKDKGELRQMKKTYAYVKDGDEFLAIEDS